MSATITPQVGKRYVTRGGWVTPPIVQSESEPYPFTTADRNIMYSANGRYSIRGQDDDFDLISEYVEPNDTVTVVQPPTKVADTFRRDLIAHLYVELVGSVDYDHIGFRGTAEMAIKAADTLIEAMEREV